MWFVFGNTGSLTFITQNYVTFIQFKRAITDKLKNLIYFTFNQQQATGSDTQLKVLTLKWLWGFIFSRRPLEKSTKDQS